MPSAIVALISLTIILVGTVTLGQGALFSLDSLSRAWKQAGKRVGLIRRTDLAPVAVSVQAGGTIVEVTLRNAGEVPLDHFPRWEVIVQYVGENGELIIRWLPHTQGLPGDNQWTVKGIFLDAQGGVAEVFEPGILDPQEEVVIQIKLSPAVQVGSVNRAIIATPNGVVASLTFN